MIEELRITDLGVIKEATLALHPGCTVVTGETGAGKTMIVTGLNLLLGARADPRLIRVGADRATVEGRLRVSDPTLLDQVDQLGGRLDEDELILARHVTATGRSRAFLGGVGVPASVCADVAGAEITISGQSDQVRLADRARQRGILDRFAGPEHVRCLATYRARYAERRAAATELERLRSQEQQRLREVDLLRFGLDEVERVGPQPGEDVALAAEATRLQCTDDLRAEAQRAMLALAGSDDEAGGALADLTVARTAIDRLAGQDPAAAELSRRVAEAGYLLREVTGDLAGYLDDLDLEPGRLEQIAERRHALAGLTRKYGGSCDEVLSWAASAADRLRELAAADDRIAELAARITSLDAELADLAVRLTAARRAAATAIRTRVGDELTALALPQAQLEFRLTPTEPGPDGADAVELLFTANPGSEPGSLGRVASGGELSRVRLALEVVLAEARETGTFVFDEVDAGVGGRVAVEIGRRLAALARHAQVVVVTHLAQVAAFADRQFVVVKADDGQVSTSGVRQVAEPDRPAELARLMAGLESSESALAHAGELLALARSG